MERSSALGSRANAVSVLPSDLPETYHGGLSVAPSKRLRVNKDLQHGLEPITLRTQKNEFPRVESSGLLWKKNVSRLRIRIRGLVLQPGQWDLRKQDIIVLLVARALGYGMEWAGVGVGEKTVCSAPFLQPHHPYSVAADR